MTLIKINYKLVALEIKTSSRLLFTIKIFTIDLICQLSSYVMGRLSVMLLAKKSRNVIDVFRSVLLLVKLSVVKSFSRG